jgi:hypothetical protein
MRRVIKKNDVINQLGMVETDKKYWVLTKGVGTIEIEEGKKRKARKKEGEAIIRFIPNFKGVKSDECIIYNPQHAFNYQGIQWDSPCLGDDCPICEWSKSLPSFLRDKYHTYKQNRFYANIIVVDDQAYKDNNNKIFVFGFGKQVFDVIINFQKEFENDYMFYDLTHGMNFYLTCQTVGDKDNVYNNSDFDENSINVDEIFKDSGIDDIDEYLYKTSYNLDEFKDYDENKIRKDFEIFKKSIASGGGLPDSIMNQHLMGDNSNG